MDEAATRRLREEATMLAAVVRDTMARLDDVRLPLHILLETRFGELNENQEELLRDAQNGADALGEALRRLAQVVDVDRGALATQQELVQVNDVVRAIRLSLVPQPTVDTHGSIHRSSRGFRG
jgi:hypothetical protein